MLYLQQNQLPDDATKAKRIVLESSQYELSDGILYHNTPSQPEIWCIVVSKNMRTELLKEAHSGKFSGHFAERREYGLLRRRCWWKGVLADVKRHCRSRAFEPPLQPIPVGGPFDKIGVDVLQLATTYRQFNRYIAVFLDYLTKWVKVFAVPDQSAATTYC